MAKAGDLARQAIERMAARGNQPRPRPQRPRAPDPLEGYPSGDVDEPVRGSEDALDRRAFKKGGFSKAEKRAYAKQRFEDELTEPPKNPPPAWLNDPSLLPKKPPGCKEE